MGSGTITVKWDIRRFLGLYILVQNETCLSPYALLIVYHAMPKALLGKQNQRTV